MFDLVKTIEDGEDVPNFSENSDEEDEVRIMFCECCRFFYIMWFPLLFWLQVYSTTCNGAMCVSLIISLVMVILRVEGTLIGCKGQCLAPIDRV